MGLDLSQCAGFHRVGTFVASTQSRESTLGRRHGSTCKMTPNQLAPSIGDTISLDAQT